MLDHMARQVEIVSLNLYPCVCVDRLSVRSSHSQNRSLLYGCIFSFLSVPLPFFLPSFFFLFHSFLVYFKD